MKTTLPDGIHDLTDEDWKWFELWRFQVRQETDGSWPGGTRGYDAKQVNAYLDAAAALWSELPKRDRVILRGLLEGRQPCTDDGHHACLRLAAARLVVVDGDWWVLPLGRIVATLREEMRKCPDGGVCHHQCNTVHCWRVLHCGPLSGVYPDDEWPIEELAPHLTDKHWAMLFRWRREGIPWRVLFGDEVSAKTSMAVLSHAEKLAKELSAEEVEWMSKDYCVDWFPETLVFKRLAFVPLGGEPITTTLGRAVTRLREEMNHGGL